MQIGLLKTSHLRVLWETPFGTPCTCFAFDCPTEENLGSVSDGSPSFKRGERPNLLSGKTKASGGASLMYCQNCGSVVTQDARFCQSCGRPQSLPQPSSQSPPAPTAVPQAVQRRPKSKILWLIMGGIVLAIRRHECGTIGASDGCQP
jgi:hypothetical protein